MRKCDKPIDVCLQINKGAQYALKRGTGRRIDAEEAKTILRRAEAAGLVHLTENKAVSGRSSAIAAIAVASVCPMQETPTPTACSFPVVTGGC